MEILTPKLHLTSKICQIEQSNLSAACTGDCLASVILLDDEQFNLIPLSTILFQDFKIISTCFESGKEALAFYQASL